MYDSVVSVCIIMFFFFLKKRPTPDPPPLPPRPPLPIPYRHPPLRNPRRPGHGPRAAMPPPPAGPCADRRAHQLPLVAQAYHRSEEHTSELQSRQYLVCRLLLEKKKNPCQRQRLF